MDIDLDNIEFPADWKHTGYTLRDVIEIDPEYVEWLVDNEKIKMTNEAFDYWESVKHGGY